MNIPKLNPTLNQSVLLTVFIVLAILFASDCVLAEEYWPPTCDERCPEITVECESMGEMFGSIAIADWETCTMTIIHQICELFGFEYGDVITIDGSEFRARTQCQNPNFDDYSDVKGCCIVRHEYAHLCDPRKITNTSKDKCSEVFAENSEHTCILETANYFCGGENPRWDEDECRKLCKNAEDFAYGKIWDACMCNQIVNVRYGGSATSEDCCWCIQECNDLKRAHSLTPEVCIAKCWIDDSKVPDFCNSLSSKDSHFCNYYGGPIDFNPEKECCPPKDFPTYTDGPYTDAAPCAKGELSNFQNLAESLGLCKYGIKVIDFTNSICIDQEKCWKGEYDPPDCALGGFRYCCEAEIMTTTTILCVPQTSPKTQLQDLVSIAKTQDFLQSLINYILNLGYRILT